MTRFNDVRVPVPGGTPVSGALLLPERPRALYVLAHGAGAGKDHPFMEAVARALHGAGVGTLRYNFPYMDGGGWPPDETSVLVETVRAAVARAGTVAPGVPLLAGGKSLGGRMTSTAAAEAPLPGVAGLVFLGFPLHPRGRPATRRGDHLAEVGLPMLFLQGTRDRLADLELLRGVLDGVEPEPTLHVVEGADHGFQVLKRSGRTDDEVIEELAARTAAWCDGLAAG